MIGLIIAGALTITSPAFTNDSNIPPTRQPHAHHNRIRSFSRSSIGRRISMPAQTPNRVVTALDRKLIVT